MSTFNGIIKGSFVNYVTLKIDFSDPPPPLSRFFHTFCMEKQNGVTDSWTPLPPWAWRNLRTSPKEIPSIAVKKFDIKGIKLYFLSHCHSDHLNGIGNLDEGSLIYASPISSFIISKKYPTLKIRKLEIGITKSFETENSDGSPVSPTHLFNLK